MKLALLSLLAGGLVFFATGCADTQSTGQADSRLGARSGVTVASRDMSRVTPARPDLTPPAN